MVAEIRTAAATERRRQTRIAQICAEYDQPQIQVNGQTLDLEAHAIEENWTAEQTELAALRASRPRGPSIHSRGHEQDCTLEALQGAMVIRAGARLDHRRTVRRRPCRSACPPGSAPA